ncbi:hypothetical protein M8C21_012263 [Ambrosia artemisiifolia]|uniref:Uncharacterized protein n=1 Tax=Ambrosia artemisiifolia TaxID=4212 RepID=A0AAD5CAG5_AMBAR|nr:hypothetical protein M8C21_012263 [Ambrosia artemisiifolia]
MGPRGGSFRRFLELSFCITGIWSAYIYQGVLQETLFGAIVAAVMLLGGVIGVLELQTQSGQLWELKP